MHPLLAVFVGLPVLCLSAGLLLLVYIIMKLPHLPDELQSKQQVRRFLIRNGFFLFYLYAQSKINGKPFLVNSRAGLSNLLKPKPSLVSGSKVKSSVKFFDGVRVRFYEPITRINDEKLPGLIFIHGGGFMVCSADSYDQVTRKIAEIIEGVVISVDYRLAPENPFPAGYDDCMTATKHFFKNTGEFGVDPTRIAVCGDSAGGNLAAGVVQELCNKPRENQGICKPKLQILLYPLLQLLDLNTPSYQQHNAGFGVSGGFLPTTSIAWMTPRYLTGTKDGAITKGLLTGSLRATAVNNSKQLRDAMSHDLVPSQLKSGAWYTPPEELNSLKATATARIDGSDPAGKALWEKFRPSVMDYRIMPLYTEDLSRLPPAYIVTCGYDVLRDDGTMYAERLRKAGVKATIDDYPGALHGLMFFAQFQWGHDARKKFYSYLSENL